MNARKFAGCLEDLAQDSAATALGGLVLDDDDALRGLFEENAAALTHTGIASFCATAMSCFDRRSSRTCG